MWHYEYEDEIIFKNKKDPRNGKYMVYTPEIINKLKDKNWVVENDAFEEASYITDNFENLLTSSDGKLLYVPEIEVSNKIEIYYMMLEKDYEEYEEW